jgi:energy-coupling factor transport system permease protein
VKATIAQYYAGDSLLHRLDPRAKFVAVSALAVALFVRDSFAALAVYAAVAILACVLSGVPFAWFWRAFRPLLWLVGLTFVAQVVFAPGEPFFSFGFVHLSRRGLELAAFLSLRLVVLVLFGSVMTLTTPSIALTDGLAWLGRPLRRLRVPTDELALMVTIALRFIPTLLVELDTIMRAQRARGADFRRGGLRERTRSLVPVLVPLFVLSFRRADELALAMEARCYRPGAVRTRLHPLRAGRADAALLVVTATVIAAALLV